MGGELNETYCRSAVPAYAFDASENGSAAPGQGTYRIGDPGVGGARLR